MDDFIITKSHSLFIDRDGVINRRIFNGYVSSVKEFEFLPGVLESFAVFNNFFNRIIVVTNQQGIGKGLMTENDLQKIHSFMIKEIEKQGGRIDGIYFCPDLADKPDNCRKPSTFLARQAKNDFPEIDFTKTIMVGDSESDILFGKNAGMKTAFIGDVSSLLNVVPDVWYNDLLSFARNLTLMDI